MRNNVTHLTNINYQLTWSESTGIKIGENPKTFRPIYDQINHTCKAWLEESDSASEAFDETLFSDSEDRKLIGRIIEGYHESLLLAEKITLHYLSLDMNMSFSGRVLWSNSVAIKPGVRFKLDLGTPVTLIGRFRKNG